MSIWRQQAVILSGIFAMLGLSHTACAAPKIPESLAEQSLVYCTSVSGFSFNPQKADVGTNMNVITEQIYDKLFNLDTDSNQLIPVLAERFEFSPDGREITLYLRRNVAFQQTKWFTPTRKFNAEDVLFSLNRVLGFEDELPNLTTSEDSRLDPVGVYRQIANKAHFPYFESIDFKGKIAEIEAVSDYIVKIKLTEPDPSILTHLASPYAVILSKEYALQLNADDNLLQLDLLPVGTGIYQLENYEHNNFVRLTPNPHYWGKKAHISNIIVDFSTTGTGRMAKFLNGECDIAAFPEPSQISILTPSQAHIVETEGANLAYLAFNFQRPAVRNSAVRRQIVAAINRQRIAKLSFYGLAEVTGNVLPKALFLEDNPNSYSYSPLDYYKNMEQTDRLILWVLDEKRVYNLHPLKIAELIRHDLVKAGFEVEVRQVTRAYLAQQLAKGEAEYDLILSGWLANNFDADSFLSPILSCETQNSVTNLSNWCSDEFDQLLHQARQSRDLYQQRLIYQQAQILLEQQLPLLPLVNVNRLLVVRNGIEKVKITPFGQVNLAEITFKK